MTEQNSIQGGRKSPPWLAIALMIIVIGAAVVAYISPESLESENGPNGDRIEPVFGTACEPLTRARFAFEDGARDRFASFVREAERAALNALDTDLVAFGRPEEMALRIGAERDNEGYFDSEAQERISERLTIAKTVCRELDS